ncbi:MAG: DUF2157 domain-containing protein [Xanthomonadales bacterium]|nr:DUF2157 domain-containing protein [Gammaproteobacteria bacterium]NND57272.1 DUF2157 domain-containing protein [Xanthomonadales bacterium]NNK51622.1 DUF2157 domain-containing protein [Xanthomonadales bacterium]
MTRRAEALQKIAEIAARHELRPNEILDALNQALPPDPAQRSTGILAKILAYLGGVFVLAGIAIFIGMQWDQFNSVVRVLVTLGVGFAIFLFGLATMADERFTKVTTPALLIAALLQPTGIVVMLNEYARDGDPEHGLLFMCVVLFVQQFLTFLAKKRTVLLFTSLFFGAAGFGTLGEILNIDLEVVALALGIGLTLICYAIDKTAHRVITPFWYLAGSVFFLYGAFDLLEGSVFEIAYFGIAAGFMYLGTVVRSRTLLFSSVIALMGFTGYYFQDSLANAFGLIVMGFLLIGLSAFAMSLNRKYIRGKV